MLPQNHMMWTSEQLFNLKVIRFIFISMRNKQKEKMVKFRDKWEYSGPKVDFQEWGLSRTPTVDKDLFQLLWLVGYLVFNCVKMIMPFFSHFLQIAFASPSTFLEITTTAKLKMTWTDLKSSHIISLTHGVWQFSIWTASFRKENMMFTITSCELLRTCCPWQE